MPLSRMLRPGGTAPTIEEMMHIILQERAANNQSMQRRYEGGEPSQQNALRAEAKRQRTKRGIDAGMEEEFDGWTKLACCGMLQHSNAERPTFQQLQWNIPMLPLWPVADFVLQHGIGTNQAFACLLR